MHAEEHALEVQLPFLQRVLGEFSLVPLAVGAATPEQVAEVIDRLWGGAETLIVISSDLSHYHPYDEACAIDRGTAEAILDYSTDIDHEQACGATPVAGMLLAAKRHKLKVELLDLRNSGDTAGGRGRVVGYASFAFWDGAPGFARRAWAHAARHREEQHRGCAGGVRAQAAARRALAQAGARDLRHADPERQAARLHRQPGSAPAAGRGRAPQRPRRGAVGPRFPPLTSEELASTRVEVSLLSTPKLLAFADHADLIAQLRPGEDGLILEYGEARGTFLPQVWESLPDPEQFVAELKRKAGLSPGVSTAKCRIQRYRVLKWKEEAAPRSLGAGAPRSGGIRPGPRFSMRPDADSGSGLNPRPAVRRRR